MKELPDLDRYRPNVGICLLNREGQVWLGKRVAPKRQDKQFPYRWQMPQGGMDKGEVPVDTAYRELYEETGIRSARLLMMTPGWLVYDFPPDYRLKKGDRWRGQRQKWALMLFEGADDEVNLAAHEEQEFCEWQWTDIEAVPELIVPFKRGVYRALIDAFRPMAAYVAEQSSPSD